MKDRDLFDFWDLWMPSASYQARRDEIENYFDQTASAAWAALTSDAPVSCIRRTVRRGRDAMRATAELAA